MSLNNSNKIVTNGLVMALDGGNLKSFPGEPTTNIINSVTNTYPKVGNGWGTYNTNQYNNNTYFSIGTVTGVSNNEVTTAAAHPLRTYDVVTPQTSGGGLTAGANYYIKKTSSTTFTVHAYDGTQDGSKGFEVLRPIRNDTRISINSTSFPTMWWGSPHLPNSGLIKTIIPNAFNGHECIRLNWYRPDGVTDGMAYGIFPAVTGGQSYTFSVYYKAASASAIGNYFWWQVYYDGNQTSGILGYMYPTDKWQRFVATTTANATGTVYSYWFPNTGPMAVDMSEIQIENKTYATNFTPTSRSTTNCLLDLSGNSAHGSTFGGPTFSQEGKGSILFDGTDDYVTCSPSIGTNGTFCFWIKSSNYNGKIPFSIDGDSYGSGPNIFFTGNIIAWNTGDGGGNPFTNSSYPDSNWHYICVTNNASSNVATLYIDGAVIGTAAHRNSTVTGSDKLWFGRFHGDNNYTINAYITLMSVYNRVLSPAEIKQNYDATRKRFTR